jgi:ketosteroid isomerase-like protein
MPTNAELLKSLYERFNARDMEALLNAMHPDVLWANGMEGGHVRGREGVRSYWTRQWAMVDPHVDPISISPRSDGTALVKVHQVVRDLSGTVLRDAMVTHVFRIRDGLITRFDIDEAASGA